MSLILREYHSPRTASSMVRGGPSRRQRNKYIREIPSSLWNWTFVIPSCLRIQSIFRPSISPDIMAALAGCLCQLLKFSYMMYLMDTYTKDQNA